MSQPSDPDDHANPPPAGLWMFGAASAALGYVVFYHLNGWLFKTFTVTENISWVFLPAAIRMVAVLLAGWAGVAGLFIGSLAVTVQLLPTDPSHALTLAALSSAPSLFAAAAVQRALSIPRDLRGMTGRHLLCFGLAGGLANSTVHTVYFILRADNWQPLAGFVPMFVGDAVGTVIMLYVGAMVLRRIRLPGR